MSCSACARTRPIDFELIAVNLDQKQPGFPEEVLPTYLEALGVPFYILEKDTYSIVREVIPEGKTTCGLCSRLRRGSLYGFAQEIGATKIALGHHRDDIVETLFLNMFFNGKLKAMPPKLLSDDRKNVVIRPLAYCKEKDLARYARYKEFPIIPCNLCGSQENLQRVQIKSMLADWEREYPGRTESIFRSIRNVAPSQLADSKLFDFNTLRADPRTRPGSPSHRTRTCMSPRSGWSTSSALRALRGAPAGSSRSLPGAGRQGTVPGPVL